MKNIRLIMQWLKFKNAVVGFLVELYSGRHVFNITVVIYLIFYLRQDPSHDKIGVLKPIDWTNPHTWNKNPTEFESK